MFLNKEMPFWSTDYFQIYFPYKLLLNEFWKANDTNYLLMYLIYPLVILCVSQCVLHNALEFRVHRGALSISYSLLSLHLYNREGIIIPRLPGYKTHIQIVTMTTRHHDNVPLHSTFNFLKWFSWQLNGECQNKLVRAIKAKRISKVWSFPSVPCN